MALGTNGISISSNPGCHHAVERRIGKSGLFRKGCRVMAGVTAKAAITLNIMLQPDSFPDRCRQGTKSGVVAGPVIMTFGTGFFWKICPLAPVNGYIIFNLITGPIMMGMAPEITGMTLITFSRNRSRAILIGISSLGNPYPGRCVMTV